MTQADLGRWGGRRYYSLDCCLRETFGEKVYKITLNGGMSCPNRDGHIGTGGCIFCSAKGSGDFAGNAALSVTEQLAAGKKDLLAKRPVHSYIAYFQAFTNTYAPVSYLEKIFTEAIQDPDVRALSIATRPDCLGSDVLELLERLNRIKPQTNVIFNILFAVFALISIIPVFFVFMISISSEDAIRMNGYRFWPEAFSAEAYTFLLREAEAILRALGISVLVSVVGTILGLFLTSTMGYVISRSNYKLNGFMTMVVFIPMIFNGGMMSSYVINTQFLHLGDTVWALILPLCVSSFNVVICKTFFKTNIPDSIIESAQIDGAGQLKIFARIALPLSKPMLATIALFLCFGYWNDWFQSTLYINNNALLSLQAFLNRIQSSLEVLANNPALGVSIQQYINSMPQEGARMAMAIIIIVPIACSYPFFQKYFISGLTVGAVKG